MINDIAQELKDALDNLDNLPLVLLTLSFLNTPTGVSCPSTR